MRTATKGNVEWVTEGGYWRARVRVDGKRRWIKLPGVPREAESLARELAVAAAAEARAGKLRVAPPKPAAPPGETVEEYAVRWLDRREKQGNASVDGERGILRKHVYPRLGSTPLAAVTRADLEGFVEHLDDRVEAHALDWKTAANIWAVVRRMFRDAAASKRVSMRVLTDNPAQLVAPPDKGTRRRKQYLYPAEVMTLLACTRVPLAWRWRIAISTYTGLRAGELLGLRWRDVDLTRWTISITEAVRMSSRTRERPKTEAGVRVFTVEPSLRPLIQAMRAAADDATPDDTLVEPFRVDGPDGAAPRLRRYLRWAGVVRPELHSTTSTAKQMTWHDLRATACTWWAIRRDGAPAIIARVGHEDLKMTLAYIRAAEALDPSAFGAVFPPLPPAVLRSDDPDPVDQDLDQDSEPHHETPTNTDRDVVSPAGVEPADRPSVRFAHRSDAPSHPGEGSEPGGVAVAAEAPGSDPGPRARLERDLRRHAGDLVAADDLDGARVALDALSRLRDLRADQRADVIDLDAVRAARRG